MTKYYDKALRHVDRIKYFYENAGNKGYAQAIYHFDKLTGLAKGAKGDEAALIHRLMVEMNPLMDEMKDRRD